MPIGVLVDIGLGILHVVGQKAGEALAERERGRAADRAVDTRRAHLWGEGLHDPPLCAYCRRPQTEVNRFELCPSTGPAPK